MIIKEKIYKELELHNDLSIKELTDTLLVSKQAIHIAINQLLDENKIEKLGRAPLTIYRLKKVKEESFQKYDGLDEQQLEFLKKNFLVITDLGKMLDGIEGLNYWCNQRKLPLEKTVLEFIKTKEKYQSYYNSEGIINGKENLINTKGYEKIFLDNIYYLDFYEIERFGKTRLGTLLHYAKQGQNKYLMKILLEEARQKVNKMLASKKYDAIGYVPPTIRREVQLMKFIENHLKINLPKINIQKISGIIPIPQKSLNKIEERINNAENTFAIAETVRYKHILLIDDAVGSGSTLNQIAGKIKQKAVAKKVTGLAFVGSFKGFDVVTDI